MMTKSQCVCMYKRLRQTERGQEKSKLINRQPKDKSNVFVLCIFSFGNFWSQIHSEPFGFYCCKSFLPLCQSLISYVTNAGKKIPFVSASAQSGAFTVNLCTNTLPEKEKRASFSMVI